MTYQCVHYEVKDHIATITLDRPPMNALNFPLIDEIIAALRQAGNDAEARAVIVTSALERAFCAGLDLKAMQAWSSQEVRQFLEKIYIELYDTQYHLGKPSVAAVRGFARGGGMTVAISCDMVVAGASTDFGYSEINVGLIPAIHLVHLPRLVGRYRAFDLLFNGNNFGPQDAADLGIVNRVVPDAEVMSTAWDVASALAAKSPLAMHIGRAAFMEVNDRGYREKLATVIDAFVRLSDTEDAQEGLRAFAEKRPPQWQGR